MLFHLKQRFAFFHHAEFVSRALLDCFARFLQITYVSVKNCILLFGFVVLRVEFGKVLLKRMRARHGTFVEPEFVLQAQKHEHQHRENNASCHTYASLRRDAHADFGSTSTAAP